MPARTAIANWIVPHVATMFRHASHLTVLSGALLLVATGYLFGSWLFASAVYMPPARTLTLLRRCIWRSYDVDVREFADLAKSQDRTRQSQGDPETQTRARQTVKRYARLNLVLALPVTFAMVAAAHLS